MPLYNRKDMPQVNTQKLGKAIDMVKSKVKVKKTRILAKKLKESQVELIPKKVKGIAAKYDKPTDMKPLIISKDNYIVDGHHRWAAGIYKFGEDVKLPVYIIQLNRVNAIKLYQSIAKSLNEDINVPISVGDTVLGGKFKNKRIVVKSIGKNEKGDITINNKPLLKFRILPKLKEESIGAKIECGNCGWSWRVEDGGDDLYICHKCGNDNEAQETHATPSTDNKKTAGLPIIKRDGNGRPSNSSQYSKVTEKWSGKYKKSIDCNNPKGFSQKAHCAGKKKTENTAPNHNGKSAPYGSGYGEVDEANAVSGGKVHKFITGKNLTFKVKKFSNLHFEVLRIDNKSKLVTLKILSPKPLFGNEINAPFRTIKRGPFLKTDTSGLDESTLNEACWKGYKQVGGKKKNGKMVPNCVPISEMPMDTLKQIDTFADKKLNPVDVVLTDKHFFDRLNDPRNKKEISKAELIGFFKRLAKKKKTFLDFLDKYNQVVAVDDRTNINIPFMKQANKVIAKTVMRKKDFKTQNQKVEI